MKINSSATLFFDVESPDDVRKSFIDHMDELKSMSVYEMTLYKKWNELKSWGSELHKSQIIKAKIWTPTNILDKSLTISEIEALRPNIRWVDPNNESDHTDWHLLRVFCSSFVFDQNPGRIVKFLVYDEVTQKYLGIVSLASDVLAITARDKWIGWDRNTKIFNGKIACSAIGNSIIPTQPFGYNFLGGKLVASLLTAPIVRNTWKSLYSNTLAGITTTSLYGTESMYNSIPFWKKLGGTAGKIYVKPDDFYYDKLHRIIKEKYPEEYAQKIEQKTDRNGPVTGIKQKILDMIFREVGISASKYYHGFERGVYYSQLYENTKEFLRGEIEEQDLKLLSKIKNGISDVIDWWKPKAIHRYERLLDENRIKPEILFYNDMIGMSWKEAKQKYLADVGR